MSFAAFLLLYTKSNSRQMRLTGSFTNRSHGKNVFHTVQRYSISDTRLGICHYGLRVRRDAQ